MLPVKILLHPTDLTEASRHAFDLACQIARLRGARIVVLHVVPPPNRHSTAITMRHSLQAGCHQKQTPESHVLIRHLTGDPPSQPASLVVQSMTAALIVALVLWATIATPHAMHH